MSWSIFIIRKPLQSACDLVHGKCHAQREEERPRLTSKSQIPALNVINGDIDILPGRVPEVHYES